MPKKPCLSCDSSDGMEVYQDGHGYCFVCETRFDKVDEEEKDYKVHESLRDNKQPPSNPRTPLSQSYRGLTPATLEFFGIEKGKGWVSGQEKDCVYFPYPGENVFKLRSLEEKGFSSYGLRGGALFGKDRFESAPKKVIVITEGEIDAMSVYQMFNGLYPTVSIRGSSSAKVDIKANYEFLSSFEKIYLALDNDVPGQKAVKDIALAFPSSKVYHVKMSKFKDANEYLTNDSAKDFKLDFIAASKFLPDTIKNSFSDIMSILKDKTNRTTVAEYPFPTLNEMTYGIRFGEVNLFTAPEKVGKTSFMKAIEHHLLKTTKHNVGILHIEENDMETVQGLVNYELNDATHLPDSKYTEEDQMEAFKKMVGDEERVYLYSHYGSDDPDHILNTVRYLAGACECKFIFLDHITMVVTGHEGDDERRKLDYISTKLGELCRELDFTLFLVSHENDTGQTRGSRNISKAANLIVQLRRDITAQDEDTKNTTNLVVVGNRFGGQTGSAGALYFNKKSHTVAEKTGFEEYVVEDNEETKKELPF